MSYARWIAGHSDVYVFEHTDGYLLCYECKWGQDGAEGFHTTSKAEMIEHLERHIEYGDLVPDYAINRLREELKMSKGDG